ncbi:NADPH-dependent F420 reductase [Spirosoma koreense]
MTIGILGAGNIGKALAGHLSEAGHQVLLSNSKGPDSLSELATQLGANVRPVWAAEASKAELVILSVPWPKVKEVVGEVPDWTGKIVIDTTNHILSMSPFTLEDLQGKTSGEVVAGLLPGAHVVKAFNTLGSAVLASNPVSSAGNRVIVLSGDDKAAKKTVAELISSMGFSSIDLGTLHEGGKLQDMGGSLSIVDLIRVSDGAKK